MLKEDGVETRHPAKSREVGDQIPIPSGGHIHGHGLGSSMYGCHLGGSYTNKIIERILKSSFILIQVFCRLEVDSDSLSPVLAGDCTVIAFCWVVEDTNYNRNSFFELDNYYFVPY